MNNPVDRDAREECESLRGSIRKFLEQEVTPNIDAWRNAGCVARAAWRRAGEMGLLGISTPTEYGGMGGDFRHEAVLIEELGRISFFDFNIPLHNAIVTPYILHYGSEQQKQRWLPQLASGERVSAIAMTEPGTGSDLRAIKTNARRDRNGYRLNGQKTFISNGQLATLIVVAAQTETQAGAKVSLFVMETEKAEGFSRGRNLEKIGAKAQDTSELFFDDVALPPDSLLGEVEGRGFAQMSQQLPQERLLIALQAVVSMEAAIAATLAYTRERKAFGRSILDFQNSRFKMAEIKTTVVVARNFVETCIGKLVRGELDADTAAMAKWWTTERQSEALDACLQLFGGYGYMLEYPIAQMWADARVQRIYGGTTEIMKEIIARNL
ncbi:MAG: acyl-CoA dehydrogenase [Rhizobiales bacterium 65-9]|nr:acyl-CoA dehydrogenase family protein [Hyphomicrobiales bacterium]OJY32186.1 MAG: acyl-CoA dehydrogenase [Rhizobiales bacterium 65-9]